jgi:hypothetical protein
MSELICPRSGEPCQFLSYCDSKRETLESGDTTGKLAEKSGLPEEIAEALDVGFCADERIAALAGLADRSDVSHPITIATATMMAAQINGDKRLFPTPDPAEAT